MAMGLHSCVRKPTCSAVLLYMLKAAVVAEVSATARKETKKMMGSRMMVSRRGVLGDHACTGLVRSGQ